jgi:hypothetical protein
MSQLPDNVIIYQLDKIDQGGDVTDLMEDRLHFLSEQWGYPLNEDGDIALPDGRIAGFKFEAFIYNPPTEEEAFPDES